MQFHYIATQPDGKIVESDIDGRDVAEILEFLTGHGLRPVSVKPLQDRLAFRFARGRITVSDQIFLSKYLGLMLKIGTGILQAINILIEDFDKPAVRNFLVEVRSNLEKGSPFFTTFAKYPRVFNQVYINLVRAGEASGSLERVFENLTTSLTKEKALKDQVRGAFIYPAILMVMSLAILFFLVVVALPKIAGVFDQAGFDPPPFSKIVFGVGLFLGQNGFYFLIGLGLVVGAFVYVYRNFPSIRKFLFNILSDLPFVKDLIRKIGLQRFAATLASLIKAGMPLTQAIEITAQAVGNANLREALLRISREGLTKGLTVGEAFKREAYFPRTVVNLIAVSEKAGHIEDVLGTLADFYVSEIDSSLKTLVSFLEPILLLSLGLIIGTIALAIIIPIYQLTTNF